MRKGELGMGCGASAPTGGEAEAPKQAGDGAAAGAGKQNEGGGAKAESPAAAVHAGTLSDSFTRSSNGGTPTPLTLFNSEEASAASRINSFGGPTSVDSERRASGHDRHCVSTH